MAKTFDIQQITKEDIEKAYITIFNTHVIPHIEGEFNDAYVNRHQIYAVLQQALNDLIVDIHVSPTQLHTKLKGIAYLALFAFACSDSGKLGISSIR